MVTRSLWFLIFFITTEGFGFRMNSWGGLGAASLGFFGVLQFLLVALSLATVPAGLNYLLRNRRTGVGLAVLFVSLSPVYLILVTLTRGAFGSEVGLGELVRNLLQLKSFLLIFLFAYLVSRRNGLETALEMLAFYAVVTALSTIAIVLLQLDTAVVATTVSDDLTRLFRAIFPGALLVAAGWLLLFSRYLAQGGMINLVASLVCLGSVAVQSHRSVVLAMSVTLLVLVVQLIVIRGFKSSTRKLALGGLITSIFVVAAYYVLFISDIAITFLSSALLEAALFTGNAGHRLLIVANSFRYVFSDTLGFGLGLDWEGIEDFGAYLFESFAAGPTFDSSYANIIIVFGLPGMILYTWLFARLFSLGNLRHYSRHDLTQWISGFFLRPLLVYCLVVGFGTDLVLIAAQSTTFTLVIVIAVRLNEMQRLKEAAG